VFVAVSDVSAEDIVRFFEEDARARKRLAELLVSEPDVRLAIINAVLRDVATKHDVERLEGRIDRLEEGIRRELKEKIEGLHREFDTRLKELDKRINFIGKITLALTASVLAALIIAILKLAFGMP